MRSRLVLILLVSAVGAATAGCGQSEEEAFNDDFRPLNDDIIELGRKVGRGVSDAAAKSNKQLEREFGGYADELDELRGDVEDLDPPQGLEAKRDALTAAMGRVQESLEGISDASRKGSATAAAAATRALIRRSARLRAARVALAKETGADSD
jgi:hypothetical protein